MSAITMGVSYNRVHCGYREVCGLRSSVDFFCTAFTEGVVIDNRFYGTAVRCMFDLCMWRCAGDSAINYLLFSV